MSRICRHSKHKKGKEGLFWACRIGRIEGILRVIGTDAAEPERVQRAEASVSTLMQQLTELQKAEAPLSEQVSGIVKHCKGLRENWRMC